MGHHAAAPAHAGHVHFIDAGEFDDGAHVVGVDPGPRHQAGPSRQRLVHGLQGFEPRQRGRRMAGAQNALATRRDDRLEIQPPVGGEIDGPVEGDAERPRRLDQLPELAFGYPSIFIQQTDHHPLQARSTSGGDIQEHHLELAVVEAKISGAWTDHGVDGDGGVARHLLHETIGGSETAQPQRRAELDAIGAGRLGGEQGFEVVDTDFKTGHDDSLFGEIRPSVRSHRLSRAAPRTPPAPPKRASRIAGRATPGSRWPGRRLGNSS